MHLVEVNAILCQLIFRIGVAVEGGGADVVPLPGVTSEEAGLRMCANLYGLRIHAEGLQELGDANLPMIAWTRWRMLAKSSSFPNNTFELFARFVTFNQTFSPIPDWTSPSFY